MSRVLHRSTRQNLDVAVAGDGLMLTLSDGRTVIDAAGGAAVACLGHGNARVAEAIARQAKTLAYVHTVFFSTETAEALADLLVGHEPGGLTRVFFVSGGSEAMEASLKLARQYFVEKGEPERTHFIARRQSYHGNTFGALAASGHVGRRSIYDPILMSNFSHVSPCFAFRYKEGNETSAQYPPCGRAGSRIPARRARQGDRLHRRADRRRGRRVRYRRIRLLQGDARGVRPPRCAVDPGRDHERHGALGNAARVGAGGRHARHPGGREGARRRICACWCRAGLPQGGGRARCGYWRVRSRPHVPGPRGRLRRRTGGPEDHPGGKPARQREDDRPVSGRSAQRLLRPAQQRWRLRGRGLFQALEFVRSRNTNEPFELSARFSEVLKTKALEVGLGIYPNGGTIDGKSGDHVIIAPPYNATRADVDEIVSRLERAVALAARSM